MDTSVPVDSVGTSRDLYPNPSYVQGVSNSGTETIEETSVEAKTSYVRMWKVLLHNDDMTTMEFVIRVLIRFFGHSPEGAYRVMMAIHRKGIGLAGVYPMEVAELKQEQVVAAARPYFPLKVTIEPA
jgi:ATP-dependent Clp protease adaptor protein ClpS